MKLLDTQDIRDWDKYTIEHEPISSLELMERASRQFVNRFITHYNPQEVVIVCGSGNNGGDGLAIARLLHHLKFNVKVYLFEVGTFSADNLANQERLPSRVAFRQMEEGDDLEDMDPSCLLIDALFGSGLSRPLEGYWTQLIDRMNAYPYRVAVDIPSGVFAQPQKVDCAFQADLTITFQLPKWAFLFPEFEPYVGNWEVVDIGLHPDFPGLKSTHNKLLNKEAIQALLRKRSKFDHKGNYGHGLLIAGSLGKVGAAILSAKACMRSGIGLLSVEVPHCAYNILQTTIPEAMVRPDRNEYYVSDIPQDMDRFQAIGIGPGLDQRDKTVDMFDRLLNTIQVPIIIDADALNILAQHPDWLKRLPDNTVLTPHPGEFDRLFGPHETSYDRFKTALAKSKELGVCIVLKGAYSLVVDSSGSMSVNNTGNSGMATAGSGDVLTGVILSLLAQGYVPFEAAQIGVFWHGMAGDCASQKQASISMIASDIIRCLGVAYEKIQNSNE